MVFSHSLFTFVTFNQRRPFTPNQYSWTARAFFLIWRGVRPSELPMEALMKTIIFVVILAAV